MTEAAPLVSGEIFIEDGGASFTGATIYIYLEDVSRADAASTVIAKHVLHDVSYSGQAHGSVPFAMTGEITDQRARYALRVHVDVNKDGRIDAGDYISTESYPVLTFGYPKQASIRVRKVT